jgi:hypothetical protein
VSARVVVYGGLSDALLNHSGVGRGKEGLEGGKADLVKNNTNVLKKYFKQSFPTYYIQL